MVDFDVWKSVARKKTLLMDDEKKRARNCVSCGSSHSLQIFFIKLATDGDGVLVVERLKAGSNIHHLSIYSSTRLDMFLYRSSTRLAK